MSATETVPTPAPEVAKEAEKEKVASETSKKELTKEQTESVAAVRIEIAQGKRSLLVGDIPVAVTAFADACQKMVEVYGEMGPECGDVYLQYGKSLLEMARMEAGVIENVMDGVPEEEDEKENSVVGDPAQVDEKEKLEIEDQVHDALEESTKKCDEHQIKKEVEKEKKAKEDKENVANEAVKPDEKGDAGKKEEKKDSSENSEEEEEEDSEAKPENGEEKAEDKEGEDKEDAEEEEGEEEEGKENESIASNDDGTSNAKEGDDAKAQAAEDDDDPSNLQLSWEMLELAKRCLQMLADSLPAEAKERMEVEERIQETYQTLGEVSIENENYDQAIEDLIACLKRRQEFLPEDSRIIAETHYQMGVAYGFGMKFDEAEASLNDAIAVLQKRVQNLKDKCESKDEKKAEDAFHTREKEIKEIESLIPEIKEKIADTQDMAKESIKRIGDRVLLGEGELESTTNGKEASTITTKGGSGKSSNGLGGKSSSTAAVSDISHMVKKRKKSDEENGASETKKPCLEEPAAATNGAEAK